MPTRKQLNQRHPSCDPDKAERLRALYEGGERFKRRLAEFLPQQPSEPAAQYELRKKIYRYRNYIGPIVDYFTALLFASPPVIATDDDPTELPDYYSAFRKDADRAGTDLYDMY
jgi:hypothetical protein